MKNSYVRARIDENIKNDATIVLNQIGLTISDVVRIMITRIAEEKRLPFELSVPNQNTRAAIVELESGLGNKCDSIEALMTNLNADD
ncbi:TPA: type II toxin-antitoxin system RelB/DinJ family antitoxin [Salmonella enterica]|nr:type II toxin-antitoxin system RelB/DinJ family antitoxin [Salmonella enterica]HAK7592850.1 type II toxin-antitoxin system RelB/DinJ family antitoxin [Salmonella enterica]HCL4861702.1 type II toxin-antitoxin system RelB/DinJ family antitoxin [Salmonella enterica]